MSRRPRVLIGYSACGRTRGAFQAAGCEAWTCDLLPARDGSFYHLQCDVWEALRMPWDAAVLHPMCTYLTCSAAWAFKDPDFSRYPGVGYHQKPKAGTLLGPDRRAARESAIANFRRLLELPFPVALENPATSFINRPIRPPDQVIQPYQFGDDASKATGLWLSGLPGLKLDDWQSCDPRMVCENGHVSRFEDFMESPVGKCPKCSSQRCRPRWANQTDSGQNRLIPGANRWLERSETYPGIAAAMGDQWGTWLTCKL